MTQEPIPLSETPLTPLVWGGGKKGGDGEMGKSSCDKSIVHPQRCQIIVLETFHFSVSGTKTLTHTDYEIPVEIVVKRITSWCLLTIAGIRKKKMC